VADTSANIGGSPEQASGCRQVYSIEKETSSKGHNPHKRTSWKLVGN